MTYLDRRIWRDGSLVPWQEDTVHVLSQSIQRGTLVFDVMAVYERPPRGLVIFGLREHVQRFVRSMELSGMETPYGIDELERAIGETVRDNPDAQIVKISAYYPGIALTVMPVDERPSVSIAAFRIADFLPVAVARKPARLQIADTIKVPSRVFSPEMKIAASYTNSVVAKRKALAAGYDDILYLDESGNIAESSTQSFVLVENGSLLTAPVGVVLAGVTRQAVVELAESEGIPSQEAPLEAGKLDTADEAFLTGTSINLWPVSALGERELPQPVPGPITKRLAERLDRLIAGQDGERSERWLQPV